MSLVLGACYCKMCKLRGGMHLCVKSWDCRIRWNNFYFIEVIHELVLLRAFFLPLWIHSPQYIQKLSKIPVGINCSCKLSGGRWFLLTVAVLYNRILLILLLFVQPKNSRSHLIFPFNEGEVIVSTNFSKEYQG